METASVFVNNEKPRSLQFVLLDIKRSIVKRSYHHSDFVSRTQ